MSASAIAASRPRWPVLHRFARHRLALIGVGIIVLLVLACAIGPSFVPYNEFQIDIRHRFQPPFAGPHLLGTDELGRDLLARLLMAGRISLSLGCAAMMISVGVGTVVGTVAGFYGGLVGDVLMRLVDAVL
ncbi:MAG TPA: hypothetical protein VG672_10755, partial [Bryobacteraceae bacterium]|nr:hypothetical protein [Bryobacteraceae bacterium]